MRARIKILHIPATGTIPPIKGWPVYNICRLLAKKNCKVFAISTMMQHYY